MPIEPIPLDVTAGDERVPTLLFVPRSERPLPLVLLGPGAQQWKEDPIAQLLAKAIAHGVPAGVALIDSPGHGERRISDDEGEYLRDVRRRMDDPAGDGALPPEWAAVATAARAAAPVLSGPLGYAGFSMGALFGLSIVADLPDVHAAVFALGGVIDETQLGRPSPLSRTFRVREGASRLGEREVLMLNMTRDEHFPIAGAIDVFEAIPGAKRMGVWAGTHVDIPPEAIVLANQFFARTLAD